jgi:hypothetical protein
MKVVAGLTVSSENEALHAWDCMESLRLGTSPPDEILLTVLEGIDLPSALKTMIMSPTIIVNYVDKDYGSLGVLFAFLNRYPSSSSPDVSIVMVNSTCTYPPHLINEYVTSVPELEKSLAVQLPESKGCIFGISGILMTEDKKKNMDAEFASLISDNDNDDSAPLEKLTVMSQTATNATVHYLDIAGSIIIHRRFLSGDFVAYLAMVWRWASDNKVDLSADVILCNYMASKKIVRTQICNIFINRFMMGRMGCFKEYESNTDITSSKMYLATTDHLRKQKCFYVY